MSNDNEIQEELFKEIEKVLSPYLHELLDEELWGEIISKLKTVFDEFSYERKINNVRQICHNLGEDYKIEYTPGATVFGQTWFMNIHLRRQHLGVQFIPWNQ